MKNTFILYSLVALVMAVATSARAETYTCNFTEPFFTLTYSDETKELVKYDDIAMTTAKKIENVSLVPSQSKKDTMIFKSADGQTLGTLELTNRGSDGMSERVYPFEIRIKEAGELVGGCESTQLKSHHQEM